MRQSILLLLCGLISACHGDSRPAPATAGASRSLQVIDLRAGTGPAITAGQTAVVDYTGWLYDEAAPEHKGRQFDSSRGNATPFSFQLGAGRVITGWDLGVLGLKVGGRRRLVVPPQLAYGDQGAGGVIPPGATLVFDIDLIGIQ